MKRRKEFIGVIFLLFLIEGNALVGQTSMIRGLVTDKADNPVEFANIALFQLPDSLILTGTITGSDGGFSVAAEPGSSYLLKISCLGYIPESLDLRLGKESRDIGTISLGAQSYALKEVRAEQSRIRASGKNGITTYFVNQSIQNSSATGLDVMKFIPGIQVNMMQNISIEGEEDILVLVDGVERTIDYLGQIDSELIDKMEVDRQPGTEYRSDIGAVVNVVTKKNGNKGISGHLYGEIPGSQKEVYAYPSAGLQYSKENLNLFSSYKGEFSYFDIEANNWKEIFKDGTSVLFRNRQALKQENWSHKAMAGLDWLINERSQLNLHGFVNPYSNEQDGHILAKREVTNGSSFKKNYEKEDTDKNLALGGTLYFRHLFHGEERELLFESGYYQSRAHWKTMFHDMESEEEIVNSSKPRENAYFGRFRYQSPIKENYLAETGVEGRYRDISDDISGETGYREEIWSAFGSISRNSNQWELNAGVRAEYSMVVADENGNNEALSIFPVFSLRYGVKEGSHLSLSYRRSISRPHIYQLNSAASSPDVFTVQKGNSALKPELSDQAEMEYSILSGSNYLAFGLFYNRVSDVIGLLTRVNEMGLFTKDFQNLGTLHQTGFHFKAALAPLKKVSFSPYSKGIWQYSKPDELGKENLISSDRHWTMEWGGALAVKAGNGFSFSATAMQRADVHKIQSIAFEDLLYFVSMEKTLFKKLKAGITCAVPFNEGVTYQGHKVGGSNFSEYSEDKIITSTIPFWFKIKYSFSSGNVSKAMNYSDEFEGKRVKKGF